MKIIVPIIILLAGCVSNTPMKYFPNGLLSAQGDLDLFVRSWYTKHLISMEEPFFINSDVKQYRFTWLPTFHSPMIFRISIEDERYVLHVKRTDGAGGYDAGKIIDNIEREISDEVAIKIIRKLENDCEFWEQPTKLETVGLDGSQWIFEASRKRRYHVVDRWSPRNGCFYEIGIELMSLSNLKINEIY